MKITFAYKQMLLDLMGLVQKKTGWAPTTVSKHCFGHGDFTPKLQAWDGGKRAPTLENCIKFEQFCRDQIGEAAYAEFVKSRLVSRDDKK